MIALLGKSTSEYIREIKLDEAKKYFEKGERDIETVMLKIGVNSSFHFNKNFKARFGMSIHDFFKSITKAKNTGK
jgi:AraC-like DNA-binding protein